MSTPTGTVRVLHVDDDPALAELVATYLERESDAIEVLTEHDPAAALDRLEAGNVDCVVSDYDMPGADGLELLEAVRERRPDLPFILFTGKGSEEIASEAITAGVTDYLQKERSPEQYAVLANRVENAVAQHRSQTALEESQQRLSLFIEQSPLGVLEYDENFEIVGLNDTGEEILGYTEAELRGESWERLVADSSYDDVAEVTDRLAAAEGGYHSVDENVRKDGEVIICEWHNRVVTDDDGDVVAVFSLFQDVTDRKRHERELEQYEAYLQASTDVITVLDRSRTIRYQSPSVSRILGYDSGALVGEDAFGYVHPADREEATAAFSALLSGETEAATVGLRFRAADGEWRWLEVRATDHLDHPEVGGVVTNSRDVTERHEREQELREVNALLSTLVGTLPVGVLAEDADRSVLAANDRLFELFDLPGDPADVVGEDCERLARQVSDVFADPEGFVERIDELTAEPRSVRNETLELADGRTFARSHEPIELEDGAGHLWVYRDVSERMDHERELRRRNRRLNEFASVVSHDLRSPLNVASGYLELLEAEYDDDRLERVEAALGRMEQIVTELLSLARSGRDIGATEPVDLAEAVEAARRTTAAENDLEVLLPAEPVTVEADRDRLRQLVENLLANAVEHAGPGVTVRVGAMEGGFYVVDDGPGIPEGERETVFDPGYSTAGDGAGFGLSIVEQVADAHGWDVTLHEGEAGGARFEITTER